MYLVLALTVAEEDARDCDFGVINWKCAIGVIDCYRNFCAAKWCTSGSSSEDDIFHLAAA